ncbi:PREDICTED: myotubularin-related protein 14 [Polistes dominula]|uniref:Myotubularin-related protein 14 n=1 Tax=Polistes dominula TaxID=743375 RepID=A0ABM1HSY6_POLDO|nr:PREDICTED: myotubularin-related protein 14 [Polistes dominula]
MTEITTKDLQELVVYFSKNIYQTKDESETNQIIMQRCLLLSSLDYTLSVINNHLGELCGHYPSQLILLQNKKSKNPDTNDTSSTSLPSTSLPSKNTETMCESMYDPNKLREIIKNARYARCRTRFPLPVILYNGRHICRSATLASGPEICGRLGINYFFPSNGSVSSPVDEQLDEASGIQPKNNDWQLFDRVRNQDIKLLKTLNVGTIIDFMVENKKVKYGLNVSSSEKIDKEKRYSGFAIISLPYPGCEFFKQFRENNYCAKGLIFDWAQSYVDAQICIPEDTISSQLQLKWDHYQFWDLIKLTKNYLKLILRYLNESNSGLLVHCISGWDRTPLFISLLRISLWADGAIHTSLDVNQILYYTIAYDWLLFGHNLQDRINKGEEIFFFCFYFLKYITDEDFSINQYDNTKNISTDSEPQLENFIYDTESVSSNLSLSSGSSKDSQDNPPTLFYSESSNQDDNFTGNFAQLTIQNSPSKEAQGYRSSFPPKRTSPVAVPMGCRRQRNESTSSGGSWQMISGTGSLRGSTTANASTTDGSNSSGSISKGLFENFVNQGHGSSKAILEDDEFVSQVQSRKYKLQCLRSTFYDAYKPCGFRMRENSEPRGLGKMISDLTA